MENAADALKMAAAVLIFVLALSISINAFGEVRQTSRIILDYKDREYDYTYVDDNRDEDDNPITERIVSVETIIPSMYKAYKENYKIVFKFKSGDMCLYKKDGEPVNYIDLEKEVLGSDQDKEDFLKCLLYGVNGNASWYKYNNKFEGLNPNGLYDTIKERRFKESLGIYIQEEVYNTNSSENPDANQTTKRVITYEEL